MTYISNISGCFSHDGSQSSASVNSLLRGCHHTYKYIQNSVRCSVESYGLRVKLRGQKWYEGQANAGVWEHQRETLCLHESSLECVLLKYILIQSSHCWVLSDEQILGLKFNPAPGGGLVTAKTKGKGSAHPNCKMFFTHNCFSFPKYWDICLWDLFLQPSKWRQMEFHL